MFAQQLEFDFEFGCPEVNAEYYRDGAQDLIQRLVPHSMLEATGAHLAAERLKFADALPLICWSDLSKAPCTLSVLLLCKYRLNACNFFYDMISRWLLPQRRINVEVFFASDVRLPHLSDDLLSVAEIVVYLKSAQDVEEVRRNLHAIETEIRLGVVSNYHARRILEFKGLSNDGKTAMIQEKIGSLIQSHSKDFDRGIFSQMQQFLVTCREEFKKGRDYHHISRMISNLYSLRKVLKQNVESSPNRRHVSVKFLKTRLLPLHTADVEKSVLGVLVGLNFLGEHELFEETHLTAAIQKHLPMVRMVPGSFFIERESDASIQTLYLEIEKVKGFDFNLDEVQLLRNSLPDQIKGHIEQLTHPIFMPRNEEEVLRNIMALSRQLRYVNDLPQVIISFDEQKKDHLSFTVILLRILGEDAPTVETLFTKSHTQLKYLPDRVRRVGQLRRKYVKEATVFRTLVPSSTFLRNDRSVDFYKAREHVLHELTRIVGEMRDYNGGMIYKQNEVLCALKASLGRIAVSHNILIEKFFYALMPMEMRTVLDTEPLKQFFLLLLQAKKHDLQQKKQDIKKSLVVTPIYNPLKKKQIENAIANLRLPAHQLVSFSLEIHETQFLGHLLLSEDPLLRSNFLAVFEYSQIEVEKMEVLSYT
jgi:hypothetical protein